MNRTKLRIAIPVLAAAATLGAMQGSAVPGDVGLPIAVSATALAEQSERGPDNYRVVTGEDETNRPRLQTPTTERIEVSARPESGNRLATCHLAGHITLWVSRPMRVLDDMREELGTVETGLAQFGGGTKLEGCVPGDGALNLSDQFVNFVVADDSPAKAGAYRREAAGAIASQLAQDFYHIAEPEGTLVPLVDGPETSAIGSVSHQFTIVLVRNPTPGSFDAVIHRETLRTKFSPRLPEADRRLSRAKWSSVQQD